MTTLPTFCVTRKLLRTYRFIQYNRVFKQYAKLAILSILYCLCRKRKIISCFLHIVSHPSINTFHVSSVRTAISWHSYALANGPSRWACKLAKIILIVINFLALFLTDDAPGSVLQTIILTNSTDGLNCHQITKHLLLTANHSATLTPIFQWVILI